MRTKVINKTSEDKIREDQEYRDCVKTLSKDMDSMKKTLRANLVLNATILLSLFVALFGYVSNNSKNQSSLESKASKVQVNHCAEWLYEFDSNRSRAERYYKSIHTPEVERGGIEKTAHLESQGDAIYFLGVQMYLPVIKSLNN